jgi:hypothetical protein
LLNHIENLPTTNTLESFNVSSNYSNYFENSPTTNTLGTFNIPAISTSLTGGSLNYNRDFSDLNFNFNFDLSSSSQIAADSLTANMSDQFRNDWSVYGAASQQDAKQRALAREQAYAMSPAIGPKGNHGQLFDLGASLANVYYSLPTLYMENIGGKLVILSDAEVESRRQAEAKANRGRYYNARESILNLEIELNNIRYPNPHELELRAQDPTRYPDYQADRDRKWANRLEDQLRGKIDDFNNTDWNNYYSAYSDNRYA